MSSLTEAPKSAPRPTWFVGAMFGGKKDQTKRFIAEGVWENNHQNQFTDLVKEIQAGDRIAIKAAYVKKKGLPFDNRGHFVSTMAIKAVGTVIENLQDGHRLRVDWTEVEPAREWYFYTYQPTVWKVVPGATNRDALIAFAFDGVDQDIDYFRNRPFWRARFGTDGGEHRFKWSKFYEELADKLLAHRHDRSQLIAGLKDIASRFQVLKYLGVDQYPEGGTGFLRDICPFTTLGVFNRDIKPATRRAIAAELAELLGVTEAVPETFEGIPLSNNLNSWYFGWEKERPADQIDHLWSIFAAALELADAPADEARDDFRKAFDLAMTQHNVSWNLTSGLFWARPWAFPSLDANSRDYITQSLGLPIGKGGPKGQCSGEEYLRLMAALEGRFGDPAAAIHSYPELSLKAWTTKDGGAAPHPGHESSADEAIDPGNDTKDEAPYSIDAILGDGCFLEREELEGLLERLRAKKNLILQGPPGTGKTWLAKRLAFALIGHRADGRVRSVQFHPNLSYEDFVRGWRPTGDGKLTLAEGVFMEAIQAAKQEPAKPFVVVIEEINRGNPAQIFGELLTLLEASKRQPSDAVELCYPDRDGIRRPIHVPANLYVVGTMNIADRSLAMVDFALRRRFAFAKLEPRLGARWRTWIVDKFHVDPGLASDIEARVTDLNKAIATDARLGEAFCVGHSFVTPIDVLAEGGTKAWFRDVVDTEIAPLLEEYWFDAPEAARKASAQLLHGW